MKAPQLSIQEWLNAPENYKLDLDTPRVKVIHAFQMLCPGCVYHGIPQTVELFNKFKGMPIDVVGLHTVFENHHAMEPSALQVFIKEWRLPFPVAVDQRLEGKWMPETMKAYDLLGTPSTIIIDQQGDVLVKHFGVLETEDIFNFVSELTKQNQPTQQA